MLILLRSDPRYKSGINPFMPVMNLHAVFLLEIAWSEVASGNLSTASTYALQVQAGRGSLSPQVFPWVKCKCEET